MKDVLPAPVLPTMARRIGVVGIADEEVWIRR